MTTVSDLPTLTDTLRDLTIDDDLSGRDAFNAMRTILTLRNLIDHHAAHLVATLERLGVATTHGRKTRELLIVMGCAPAVAARLIRIAGSTTTLQFMGSLTETTLQQLSCDATVTTVIIDDQQVPLQLSKNDRFFTGHLRTALYIRDECCIKCGAPAARSHGHHIQHWAHNGTTVLDNGCLLCPSCHADIHHNGWDVIIGTDNHPWLIPPATVDPQRTPLPAYNRRTLTLDNLPTAA